MTTKTIESIVADFERENGLSISKITGKKIIYEGKTKDGNSIVVAMPSSKIYSRGNGWVDFTKIQIDLFRQYQVSIVVFRLSDGTNYYVDMNNLIPLLTPKNMMENEKEGEHWKMDIWPNKIVIRKGGETLHIVPNEKKSINQLL